MHDGQTRRIETYNPEGYPEGSITDGEGRVPANTNPDTIGSMTISAYENGPQQPNNYDAVNNLTEDPESFARTYTYSNSNPGSSAPQNQADSNANDFDGEWAGITISGGGKLDLQYVVKIEKFADKKLKQNDPAGFVSAIRDFDGNGIARQTMKNAFGANSEVEKAK